jgi:hypothetical protein
MDHCVRSALSLIGVGHFGSRALFAQSTYFPRDETGLVCLLTQHGAYTAILLVMVNVMRGGGRVLPTLTSQG